MSPSEKSLAAEVGERVDEVEAVASRFTNRNSLSHDDLLTIANRLRSLAAEVAEVEEKAGCWDLYVKVTAGTSIGEMNDKLMAFESENEARFRAEAALLNDHQLLHEARQAVLYMSGRGMEGLAARLQSRMDEIEKADEALRNQEGGEGE